MKLQTASNLLTSCITLWVWFKIMEESKDLKSDGMYDY